VKIGVPNVKGSGSQSAPIKQRKCEARGIPRKGKEGVDTLEEEGAATFKEIERDRLEEEEEEGREEVEGQEEEEEEEEEEANEDTSLQAGSQHGSLVLVEEGEAATATCCAGVIADGILSASHVRTPGPMAGLEQEEERSGWASDSEEEEERRGETGGVAE